MSQTFHQLIGHFKTARSLDRAIANYYLYGIIQDDCPSDWDWNDIILNFNQPAKTLAWALTDAAEAFRKL